MSLICEKQYKKGSYTARNNMISSRHKRKILLVMIIEIHLILLLYTSSVSCKASEDDLSSKRTKRPSIISQKNLIEARDENGVHSIVPHHIYSNENSNLNSVGLSESAVGSVDGKGLHNDVGQVLQGPNVCTKQEP